MPIQNVGSYTDDMGIGFEGAASQVTLKQCRTIVSESGALPYGRIIAFDPGGTVDKAVKLTDAGSDVRLAVTFHSNFSTAFDLNTGVAQVSTVTVGGVIADGDYDITLFVPNLGAGILVRVVRATTPANNNDMATALRAAINAHPQLALQVIASGAGADVVIASLDPGSFGVLTAVTGGGTLVAALTTGGEADGIAQNEPANGAEVGSALMRPEDAVTPASGVFVRITANAGVGTALGAVRGTADGGNTRDISALASWSDSSQGGAAGSLARLVFNFVGT